MTEYPHIETEQWRELLADLRGARAAVLADAEAFDDAVRSLEAIGRALKDSQGNGLGDYRAEIVKFASGWAADDDDVEQLFMVIKDARNDRVHRGTQVRHMAKKLVKLILLLEETIVREMKSVRDVMVENPVCAELWHRVADLRTAILANSFSSLPFQLDGEWRLVSDTHLVDYLKQSRRARMNHRLDEALERGLKSELARAVGPLTKISDLEPPDRLLLVLDEQRLVGIVTAFDLL